MTAYQPPQIRKRYTSRLNLKKHWGFTRDAEWILWESPHLNTLLGYQLILKEPGLYLEWRNTRGFAAGIHDDGEVTGAHKQTPVLQLGESVVEVARAAALRALDRLAPDDPVPEAYRGLIRSQVERLSPDDLAIDVSPLSPEQETLLTSGAFRDDREASLARQRQRRRLILGVALVIGILALLASLT